MPRAAVEQIGTVVESADAFVARMEGPPRDVPVDPGPRAERFVALARWLAREVAGHAGDLNVRFFERKSKEPSAQVDAEFDRAKSELRVNVRGRANLDDPLDPATLGLLLHELAHDASGEHDVTFTRRLQALAGRALRRVADRPADLGAFRAARSPSKR
jgi:hypothetical protein